MAFCIFSELIIKIQKKHNDTKIKENTCLTMKPAKIYHSQTSDLKWVDKFNIIENFKPDYMTEKITKYIDILKREETLFRIKCNLKEQGNKTAILYMTLKRNPPNMEKFP